MVGLVVDLGFLGGLLGLEGGGALDPAAAAHRVDRAGADAVLLPLGGEDRPGFTSGDAIRVRSILRSPMQCSLRGLSLLEDAVALAPSELLFLSDGGGPLSVDIATAGTGPLSEATARVRAAGILPVVGVLPLETEILAAQDAGAVAVELFAGEFGSARTEDAALDAWRRLGRAAATAADIGLRVRAGGGATAGGRLSRLAELPEVEAIRVGAALLAGAVYEGIGPAVRAARMELDRGERRSDPRGVQEEEE